MTTSKIHNAPGKVMKKKSTRHDLEEARNDYQLF